MSTHQQSYVHEEEMKRTKRTNISFVIMRQCEEHINLQTTKTANLFTPYDVQLLSTTATDEV